MKESIEGGVYLTVRTPVPSERPSNARGAKFAASATNETRSRCFRSSSTSRLRQWRQSTLRDTRNVIIEKYRDNDSTLWDTIIVRAYYRIRPALIVLSLQKKENN